MTASPHWCPAVREHLATARSSVPTAEQKELLIRAATLTGQTLSEFMRTAVEERAQRVIAEHERIVLNGRASETFLTALAKPPRPNDRLVALAERYAREVKSRP